MSYGARGEYLGGEWVELPGNQDPIEYARLKGMDVRKNEFVGGASSWSVFLGDVRLGDLVSHRFESEDPEGYYCWMFNATPKFRYETLQEAIQNALESSKE